MDQINSCFCKQHQTVCCNHTSESLLDSGMRGVEDRNGMAMVPRPSEENPDRRVVGPNNRIKIYMQRVECELIIRRLHRCGRSLTPHQGRGITSHEGTACYRYLGLTGNQGNSQGITGSAWYPHYGDFCVQYRYISYMVPVAQSRTPF